MPSPPPELQLADVMDALPGGALVIDGSGDILYATDGVADALGRTADELVGDSVLAYVSEETAWIYAAAVAMASDYPDVVTGPMRIDVLAADGSSVRADLWAKNRLDDPAVGGIVCLFTYETAAVGLAEAVGALAEREPFPTVADRIVRSMAGHPVVADATLVATGSTGFRVVASHGVPDDLLALVDEGPWQDAVRTGVRSLHDGLDDLPAGLALAAAAHGYAAVWAEPVGTDDLPARGALVVWRRRSGLPSPNQVTSLHHGAAIATLAWDRHEAMT